MACDITNILGQLNSIIDTSIKGSAASISQNQEGNFEVTWGDQFRVKNKAQAVNMAEQKVSSTNKLLDKEGFSPSFGPYLDIDKSLTDMVMINKIDPIRLKRAVEMRNEAEEREQDLEDYLTQEDLEFFQQQESDQALLEAQEKEIDEPSLLDEALTHADKLTGMNKDMFKIDPREFLKFAAEQYWNMRGLRKAGVFDFEAGTGLDAIPDEIMDIAKKMFPNSIQPDGLPAINLDCK